jgi:hypothetical protein
MSFVLLLTGVGAERNTNEVFFFFFFFFFLVYFLCVEGRRRGWSKLGFFSFVLYILITMSN